MASNIETFEDGTSAFFSNREVAWHKLGVVTDNAQTANQALQVAQLDSIVKVSENSVAAEIDGKMIGDGKPGILTQKLRSFYVELALKEASAS
jgi:hypothetical protein